MEEWAFVDDRELESFRGHKSCATCDHFGYVTLRQCQVLGSCHSDKVCWPLEPTRTGAVNIGLTAQRWIRTARALELTLAEEIKLCKKCIDICRYLNSST